MFAMPRIQHVEASTITVPTDGPESDGTLAWEATTVVVVEARADGVSGLGYTYGDAAIARVVERSLAPVVGDRDALDVPAAWLAMVRAVRNDGRAGLAGMAVSAVDIALHDLRARLLGLPLFKALGAFRHVVPIYGSGGFCSYDDRRLAQQLGGWVADGIPRVKMKVGREPDRDAHRLRVAREAIGPDVELFVDANGAWDPRQAVDWTHRLAEQDVRHVEEPVSSDDLDGMRFVRDHAPPGVAIAAGEYCYDLYAVRTMLQAGAVDVQQVDVTRCGGITELVRAGALCEAHGVPLSAHCAPAISAHACCAVQRLAHLEYFHDHVRVEAAVFDGTLDPDGGVLEPDGAVAGHGLALRDGVVRRADEGRPTAA